MIQKIFIADDEPEVVGALAELLQSYGFEVCTAGSPEEFQARFVAENPDLILLDINFGSRSGPDVYDDVMKSTSAPKTPVAFVSGLVDPRSESPLVKGRQVAMYAKPLNVKKLVRDIRTAFADSIAA